MFPIVTETRLRDHKHLGTDVGIPVTRRAQKLNAYTESIWNLLPQRVVVTNNITEIKTIKDIRAKIM